jgi:putative FmdB family regulatory protein
MPLFEFLCMQCGQISEALVTTPDEPVMCNACGSRKLKKMLSAPSTLSGVSRNKIPGPGDTSCCGSSPTTAGCAGPGSCCGKMHP